MSTKLTKAAGKQDAMGKSDAKSAPMSEPLTVQGTTARTNLPAGLPAINVMTAQETADLLARLQDILSLWSGSDNKIIGEYVMTAFPIPAGVDITKLASGHDNRRVFCVNGSPVTSVMTTTEGETIGERASRLATTQEPK